jgi:hypothetical protein
MIDNLGIRGLCFDSEEGYEAMCMGLIQGQPGVTFRHDWKDRITLGVVEGVASVVLHDAQGNPAPAARGRQGGQDAGRRGDFGPGEQIGRARPRCEKRSPVALTRRRLRAVCVFVLHQW